MYVYRLLYQNLMVTTKQKSKINMYTKEKKYSKCNNKEVINLQKKEKKEEIKKKKNLQSRLLSKDLTWI